MLFPIKAVLASFLVLVVLPQAQGVTCAGSDKTNDLCCMGSGPIPWTQNSYVWGDLCRYYPADPNSLTGGRCVPRSNFGDGKCPSTTYQTCCQGTWPGQCALGTNCGTPVFPSSTNTAPTPTFTPGFVPPGWTRTYNCAVDVPSRILTNVVTYQDFYTNSPSSCINHCNSLGYTYAGVEYSNECHCGNGYSGTPTTAPESECSMGCTGDAYTSCGGSWRIRLYKKDSA